MISNPAAVFLDDTLDPDDEAVDDCLEVDEMVVLARVNLGLLPEELVTDVVVLDELDDLDIDDLTVLAKDEVNFT